MRLLTIDPFHNNFQTYLRNTYGLEPLTLEQEIVLAPNAKRTRNNKIKIIDTCASIRRLLDTIEFTARTAPVLDRKEHADLVEEFYDAIKEAYKATERAWSIGQ